MEIQCKKMTESIRRELNEKYAKLQAENAKFAPVPKATGGVYYISALHGNDQNSGTSETAPWKSLKKANALPEGSTVLIECGSVFHEAPAPGDSSLMYPKSGMTFATYGQGEKPVIYGSINASSAADWTHIGNNVYRFNQKIAKQYEIASVVFDQGKAWGIKIQMTYTREKEGGDYTVTAYRSLALSNVSNGLQTYATVASFPLQTGEELNTYDLAYYHNTQTGDFYLYSEKGNPGNRFASVELSRGQKIFLSGSGIGNLTFLNLDFRCVGEFAVRTCNTENVVVKNCNFFFIGGAVQAGFGKSWRNYDTRLGNAIENWGSCNGMTVENCCFDQIYDTAITTQANDNVFQKNLIYRNNLVRRVWFGVELWTGNYTETTREFSNVDISGNCFLETGIGFPTTRPDKFESDGLPIEGYIKLSRGQYDVTNVTVTDNTADGAAEKLYYCAQPKTVKNENGFLFARNTYVLSGSKVLAALPASLPELDGKYVDNKFKIKTKPYSYSKETFELLSAAGIEEGSTFYIE